MITQAREFSRGAEAPATPFRLGVTSGLRSLPAWKREADFLLAQVTFSAEALLEWRASLEFTGPVYAGVMVVPSAPMARKLSADIPELAVPPSVIAVIERDRDAGLAIACDLISEIRESGAFNGVHLIPVSRYREMASRLEAIR